MKTLQTIIPCVFAALYLHKAWFDTELRKHVLRFVARLMPDPELEMLDSQPMVWTACKLPAWLHALLWCPTCFALHVAFWACLPVIIASPGWFPACWLASAFLASKIGGGHE